MLVVIKVDDAGIGDFFKAGDEAPVNGALHFYGADHVFSKARIQPDVNPF